MNILKILAFKKKNLPIDLIGSKQKIRNLSTKIIPITLIYTPQSDWSTLQKDVTDYLNIFIKKNTVPDLRNVLSITIIEVIDKTFKDNQTAAKKKLILTEENKTLLNQKIEVINTCKIDLIPKMESFPPLLYKQIKHFISKIDALDHKLKHLYDESSTETLEFRSYKEEIQDVIHTIGIDLETKDQLTSISSEVLYKDVLDKDVTKTLLLNKNIIYVTHDASFYQKLININASAKPVKATQKKNEI